MSKDPSWKELELSVAEDAGTVRRLENAIAGLRGVRQARVEVSGRTVERVRVLVVPEHPTDEAVDEIRALIAREGLSLAAGAIEVLRSNLVSFKARRRRKLSSISTERTPDRFKARVVLELGGDTLVGESDAPSERSFEYRSIARATLEGLRKLLRERVELESVQLLNSGSHQLALVALRHGGQTLVGSALVKLDYHDAVARATLDALNRFLSAPHVAHDGAHALSQ